MTKFQVNSTFRLKANGCFVLAGSLLEGTLSKGMIVSVPCNSALDITAPINSIEFARRIGGEDICICISCADEDEFTLWEDLNLSGEILEISKQPEPCH